MKVSVTLCLLTAKLTTPPHPHAGLSPDLAASSKTQEVELVSQWRHFKMSAADKVKATTNSNLE